MRYECDRWNLYKTDNVVKQHLRESFLWEAFFRGKMPTKCLPEKRLLENIKSGSLFGYVQCNIEVPENLREAFANFPPIFRNINVGRDDISPSMKEFAEKGILTQPRRMLISSDFLGEWNNL